MPLQKSSKVEQLLIQRGEYRNLVSRSKNANCEKAESELIIKILLRNLMASRPLEPLGLKELHLEGIDLAQSTTYLKIVRFNLLASPILVDCEDDDTPLAPMSVVEDAPRHVKRLH